jgi:uncharacterized protein YaaR (DUF327 family)
MRIPDEAIKLSDAQYGHAAQGKRGLPEDAAVFQKLVASGSSAKSGDALRALLDKVSEQGDVVARRCDIGEVKKYRELVTRFLDQAMQSTYARDKESLFDARGRYKEFSLVRKVNEELEKLTQDVLSDQKDNLNILERLGTIKGMLVDLLV